MTAISTTLGLAGDRPGRVTHVDGDVSVEATLRDVYTDIGAMLTCGNAVRVDVNACITAHNAINAKLDADATLDVDTYVSGNNVTATAAVVTRTAPQVATTEFEGAELDMGHGAHHSPTRFNLGQALYRIYVDVAAQVAQVNALAVDTAALRAQLLAVGAKLDADDLAGLDDDYASVLAHTLTAAAVVSTMPTVTTDTFATDGTFRTSHTMTRPNMAGFLRAAATDLAAVRAALILLRADRATQLAEMTAYVAKLDADPPAASDYAATATPAAATSSAPAALLSTLA